jgi:periplasmic protein TonB
MKRQLQPALRRFGFAVSILGATAFGAAGAYASDTPAHVDTSQANPQPPYPDSADAGGEQGAVMIAVFVRPDGRVTAYRIAQSSGFDDLDTAALQSVLNWKFVPARHDGDPVADWTTVRIVFQLPQAPPVVPVSAQ